MADRTIEIKAVFDLLAAATYSGLAFRDVLVKDKEAFKAAKKLVDRLRLHRVGDRQPLPSKPVHAPCRCPGCMPELYTEGARRQQELAEAESRQPGNAPPADPLVVDDHCPECGQSESECDC